MPTEYKNRSAKSKVNAKIATIIWRIKNPERAKEIQKRYRTKNREKRNSSLLKTKRKKLKLPEAPRLRPELCELCGKIPKSTLHYDHCHTSGEFRGWICSNCNCGLGLLGDSLENILKAVEYLMRGNKK